MHAKKTILMADIHAEHSVKGANLRGMRSSVLTISVLDEIVRRETPAHVVILGDLFDAHGVLESTTGTKVKKAILGWADLGVKVLIITGNHEYPAVKEEFFGHSMNSALFEGINHPNLFLVDAAADIIRLDENTVVVGIPYRETCGQFEATCLKPLEKRVADGAIRDGDQVIVGWHVGLPFGEECYRGDEDENGWVVPEHPAVQFLFSLSTSGTIWCGHYHKPARVKAGSLGEFRYVGSAATRSRTESDQKKGVVVLENDDSRVVETGLILDHEAETVEEAASHLNSLAERFGPEVLDIARSYVVLPKGTTIDDYNIAKTEAGRHALDIIVVKPERVNLGHLGQYVERLETDPNYSRPEMEKDIAFAGVVGHYRTRHISSVSESAVKALSKKATSDLFLRASKGDEKSLAKAKDLLVEVGLAAGDSPEELLKISRLLRTIQFLGEATSSV